MEPTRSKFGLFYILYFVFVYLNLTAVWFYGVSFFRRVTHGDFIVTLLAALAPELKSVAPMPTTEGCIVLANHVNWSDFVIDICLVERGCYVSRNVLWYIFFPGSWIRAKLFGDCVFFKRGKTSSKGPLYEQVEDKVREGRAVIVYAEGTRNPQRKKLPLKLGLVKLAYEKNLDVVISMTADKADIFDEHRFVVTFHVPIVNKKSDVLKPKDFHDLTAFVDTVQREWDRLWADLFGGSS
mmetsp:Transcript_21456/g.69051  ORF Transcript_21456/g.69051 Transcript_21456/m.69051 type:complete len:239 (+) Transcript_21456:600-1316(+)